MKIELSCFGLKGLILSPTVHLCQEEVQLGKCELFCVANFWPAKFDTFALSLTVTIPATRRQTNRKQT